MPTSQLRRRESKLLCVLAYLCWISLTVPAFAEPVGQPVAAEVVAQPVAQPADEDEVTPRQRAEVAIGMYLLFGIAALGGLLLLFVLWWGHHVRQQVRRPLPTAERGALLWFLKPLQEEGNTGPPESDESPSGA